MRQAEEGTGKRQQVTARPRRSNTATRKIVDTSGSREGFKSRFLSLKSALRFLTFWFQIFNLESAENITFIGFAPSARGTITETYEANKEMKRIYTLWSGSGFWNGRSEAKKV